MIALILLLVYFFYEIYRRYNYSYERITILDKEIVLDKDYTKDRYSSKKVPSDIDVIVIGSGIGGLTTAGLLSKFGKKVLVLEQHYIAGGTTHSFEDKGVEHETGLHYIGNIKKLTNVLDLLTFNPISWCKMGWERKDKKEIYDEIFIGKDHYEFEAGEDNLINYLMEKFPLTPKESFVKYFDLIKSISKKDNFFISKIFPSFNKILAFNKIIPSFNKIIPSFNKIMAYFNKDYNYYCKKSAYDVVKEIFNDEKLISVLFGQFGDYGQIPQEASFYTHACIVHHYLDGGWYPRGGTGVIAKEMCKNINHYGGKVLVGKQVSEILICNNKVSGVIMENNDIIYCKTVVSAVGLRNTFKKLVKTKQDNIYNKMLDKIPPSVQHMYCFVKLDGKPKELNLRSSNFWIYPHGDYEKLMKDFLENPLVAPIPLFMGFSSMKDSAWSDKYPNVSNAIILTVAKKEWFEQWENEKCTKRGEYYNNFKKEIGDRMLDEGLLRFYPELKDKILEVNIGTPLSTQFYFNAFEGESYGLDMNSYRLTEAMELKPETNIEGLYLTGQDVCVIGVTGAMMGGVLTANVIAGYNNIVDIVLGNNIVNDLHKLLRLEKMFS